MMKRMRKEERTMNDERERIDAIPQVLKTTNKYGVEESIFPYTTETEVLVDNQELTLKEKLDYIMGRLKHLQDNKSKIVFKGLGGEEVMLTDLTFQEIERIWTEFTLTEIKRD